MIFYVLNVACDIPILSVAYQGVRIDAARDRTHHAEVMLKQGHKFHVPATCNNVLHSHNP